MSDNVRLLIFNETGQFLAVSEVEPDDPRIFKLPGGSLQDGETPLAAAHRELQEELGMTDVSLTLIGQLRTRGGDKRYIYLAVCDVSLIDWGPDIAAHQWVDEDNIPADWHNHQPMLDALNLLHT